MPIDYILNELSLANVVLYAAVLPSYKTNKDSSKGKGIHHQKQDIIKADDPRNNDKVDKFFESIE